MKREEIVYRYRYVGKDHTLIRNKNKWPKQKIQHWDEFESSCNPSLFRTYFVRLWKKDEETLPIQETKKEQSTDLLELVKRYINIYWKRPNKNRSKETILSKLT
jgi:hypothetical protein